MSTTRQPARAPLPRGAVARWLVADARDVTRIGRTRARAVRPVGSVTGDIGRWQRSIGRLRAIAVVRRALIVGLVAASLLQLVALATGSDGPGPWLLPAIALGALSLLPGVVHRTSPAVAARLLDRDLTLGAGVSTALELERGADRGRHGLAELAVSDGREALAQSLAGSRARLRRRRRESGLFAALIVAIVGLVLLPAPGRSGVGPRALPVHRAATRHVAENQDAATRQKAGPDLSGYGTRQTPPLTAVSPSSTRRPGKGTGRNPYGGGTGTATHGPRGAVQPKSRTLGNAGYLQTSRTSDATVPKSSSEGTQGKGKTTLTSHEAPAAGKLGSAGGVNTAKLPNEQQNAGKDTGAGTPARAGTQAGNSKSNGGTAGIGANKTSRSRQATPGGATAGGTRGGTSAARGVVPQLAAGKNLPIQPGYEAIKGARNGKDEGVANSANGAGGASHSGQAAAGANGAAGPGVAYVPPGGSSVSPVDRRLLIGYFGSSARLSAAGW